MAKDTESKKVFSKAENERLKNAITQKYNELYRKDEKGLNPKAIRFNHLNALKKDIEGLGTTLKNIISNDMIGNLSTWKVSNMSLEVGELLSKHFDISKIDLGLEGKIENIAVIINEELNKVYNPKIDKTARQLKMIDLVNVFHIKGVSFPSLYSEGVGRLDKAKVSDLSESAVEKINKALGGK